MNITFHPETSADHYAVEEMTREAFWRFWEPEQTVCHEHLLVRKVRNCPSLVQELNIVARANGEIAGHIIFTKSRVEDTETLTFGPLTVLPKFQSQGIGKALMRYAFSIARDMGFRAVIIYGNPDYYPRAGFRRAAEFGITTPDSSVFDALLVYELYDGALDGIGGKYYIDPVYESLTDEEAREFDKQFPPRQLHVFTPVGVLLDRLDSTSADALRAKDFPSLDFIKSQSEREIAGIIGGDSIQTVRDVMRAHGFNWGTRA